jgi:hypothetical protein
MADGSTGGDEAEALQATWSPSTCFRVVAPRIVSWHHKARHAALGHAGGMAGAEV